MIIYCIGIFICAAYMAYAMYKSPLDFVVSAQSNEKGAKGGCKLVLVKTGNSPEKIQPPVSPFIKGDFIEKGWGIKWI